MMNEARIRISTIQPLKVTLPVVTSCARCIRLTPL